MSLDKYYLLRYHPKADSGNWCPNKCGAQTLIGINCGYLFTYKNVLGTAIIFAFYNFNY